MDKSINTFADFKLNKQLLNAVAEAGFAEPSPIQQQAIPQILAGQDVIGIAQTGTGKTAAFALPILFKLKYAQGDIPRALILSPSKELVIQTEQHINALATYTDIRVLSLYGGIGPKTQIEQVLAGVDILVCTPGRFVEIYRREAINVKQLKTLVIDEADRMMDLGFMPQLRKILEIIPVKRQNLLFSATFPESVEKLSEEFLEFPIRIEVSPQTRPLEAISQHYYQTPNFLTKVNLLKDLLDDSEVFNKVIVFVNTKKTADNIFKYIERKVDGGVRVVHSNKGQNTRINAINQFTDGEIRILVTTDVSARGIDVNDVSHVINFDLPYKNEEYLHRIGRTGRAGKTGIAIAFINKAEMFYLKDYMKSMKITIPELPVKEELISTEFIQGEKRAIDFQIDKYKRSKDPDFKGAFHEKKQKNFKK